MEQNAPKYSHYLLLSLPINTHPATIHLHLNSLFISPSFTHILNHEALYFPTSLLLLAFALFVAKTTADSDSLQDLCIADLPSGVKVNGYACKNAANVTAHEFYYCGLARPGPVNRTQTVVVTPGHVEKVPGFNTLGLSVARIDYAPRGVNPPHIHPRASEVIFVLEGELEVGFITSANVLISKQIKKGDVFIFPKGLLHYHKNLNTKAPASAFAAFNSQLPGTVSVAASLFSASPAVPEDILAKTLRVTAPEVINIKAKFAPKK